MHIDRISSKARRLVGLLYRKFYKWASPDALLNLYFGIVRPHLEYAVPVWNPYLQKHVHNFEGVQKFALKVCTKSWDASYEDCLLTCHVPLLAVRRTRQMLCLIYSTS